jgi:general secretion pathway protein D
MSRHSLRRAVDALLLSGALATSAAPVLAMGQAASAPVADAGAPPPSLEDREVRTSVLPGSPPPRVAPARPAPARGDVSLNFPNGDVGDVAQAVLGDVLGLSYVIDPSVRATVTLQTGRPVARRDVLGLFEDALRAANLSLVKRGSMYTITTTAQARGEAQVVGGADMGFGNETVQLKFVSAAELKKLLDPIVPNAISQVDPVSNTLVVSGNTAQRQSVRELVQQFDVDWLRGMSFALFIPQRTDSRLIAPELDKLLNSPGAPTNGMVRLISMERLNGILAISSQVQYLADVRRWVEVLDREGESNERKLFVYRVQNGRSADLARTLVTAFGGAPNGGQGGPQTTQPQAGQPSPIASFTPNAASSTQSTSSLANPPAVATAMPSNQAGSSAVAGAVTLSMGGPGAITISSDEANNAIVVFATPREYAVVEDALRRLDILPLQVLIEAAITEVTLNDDLRYGVQWFFESGEGRGRLTNNKAGKLTPTFPGFSFLYNNGSSIRATLDALAGVTKINVVSAPKLMVLNNQTASLQVGDQVPVVTGSAVGTLTPNAPIVNEVEYRDTGVILRVTPRVNSGGLVLLDIAQEVSDVTQTNSSNIESPTIQQRKFASTIAVQDGQTISLGGLIRDSRTQGRSGIPVLSQIPVVGGLFGVHDSTVRRTELLVLLTPRVIRNPEEARAITDELRDKIRSVVPLKANPPLIR